jgi:hypothetical protein
MSLLLLGHTERTLQSRTAPEMKREPFKVQSADTVLNRMAGVSANCVTQELRHWFPEVYILCAPRSRHPQKKGAGSSAPSNRLSIPGGNS